VMSAATLLVNGTKDSVVTFSGDRLEAEYREIPGQWGVIQLSNLSQANLSGDPTPARGSRNSIINYALIKNGSIGLVVDTVYDSFDHTPTLTLTNTIIENMSGSCLLGRGTRIKSGNCVFANAAQYSAALAYGGIYDFRHCTFANYWNYSDRTTPALLINNHYTDNNNVEQIRNIDTAYFGNCIVYGDRSEELGLDSSASSSAVFNFYFDHSLIQVGGSVPTNIAAHYNNNVVNQNPKFINPAVNNYELDASSNAKDRGNALIINQTYLEKDLKGFDRINGVPPPDCGAYERPN
jgi:hypothetical protein